MRTFQKKLTDDEYTYAKDSSGNTISGWRIYDKTIYGDIILISAGCPEDFYFPDGNDDKYNYVGAYIAEHIMIGTNIYSSKYGTYSICKERDWSMYVNEKQGATDAEPLCRFKQTNYFDDYSLMDFAKKYCPVSDGFWDDGYSAGDMKGTRYENLIFNGVEYWLGDAWDSDCLWSVEAVGYEWCDYEWNRTLGVRVLVLIDGDTLINNYPTDSITVEQTLKDGSDYTYNVWKFAN